MSRGRVGTRRLATRPALDLLPTPRVAAVVKLAKYRFGPIRRIKRMPLAEGATWNLATTMGALLK
jgi:hypothetical protein